MAPLFLSLRRAGAGRALFLGAAAGFAFNGLAFHWIYSTCRFAGVDVGVSLLAWSALALFLSANWALIAWLGRLVAQPLPQGLRPWAWAAVWTAVTAAWERWTPRPCADLLAYTQYRHLSLLQIGAILGPHGLGLLIVAANCALAECWDDVQSDVAVGSWTRASAALALALPLAAFGYGFSALRARPDVVAGARVEVLQPDIDQYAKWDPAREAEVSRELDGLLSLPRARPPALIVWPESSLPRLVDESEAGVVQASDWGRRLGAMQIVGAATRVGRRLYNTALLLGRDGAIWAVYHKRELVPFGEYVPLPQMRRYIGILDQLGDLTPGRPRQPLFDTPLGPAAVTICYEAIFPRWVRADVAAGARIVFNLTNDGWYRDTWGPYQHFYANVFRAVENRVTVVRAGNTGISAVIDPWGVVTAALPLNQRGRLDGCVPAADLFPQRSFYARHGDWLATACLAALALLMGVRLSQRRRTIP